MKARTARSAARAQKLEEAKLSLDDVLRLRAHERREEIAEALISAAIANRDVPALRLLYDRVLGKPTDKLEVSQALSEDERAMVDQYREISKLVTLSDEELEARLEANNEGDVT